MAIYISLTLAHDYMRSANMNHLPTCREGWHMVKGGVPGLVFPLPDEDVDGGQQDTPCDIKAGDDNESVVQGHQGFQTRLPGHQLKSQGGFSVTGRDLWRARVP